MAIAEVQEPQQDSILSLSESDKRALRDAALLTSQLRETDTVARVGVNHYALLIRRVAAEQEQQLSKKSGTGLARPGVPITTGCAMRLPYGSLSKAVRMADIRMYNSKLRRNQ